jgi:hypothetical protein
MNIRTFLTAAILFLALVLTLPQGASAEAVGRLTEVQGRVDLLKGGKLPATPVKVGDAVEPGDVLRAKSLSKAQITFLDNTTLTMSPESRIAIDEYTFDPAKQKRSVLLEVFHGAVLAVVSKIYQTEQPDFLIKSHTAIMGIRGTEVGMRLTPNDTTILNFHGWTTVANVFPEVEDSISKKAKKIAHAFSFGPSAIDLKNNQGAVIAMLERPKRFDLSDEIKRNFQKGMDIVASVKPQAAVCSAGSPANACAPGATAASGREGLGNASNALGNNPGGSGTPGGGITIVPQIPQLTQVAQAAALQTFSFAQQYFSGAYNTIATTSSLTYSSATASGTITGASPATFQPNFAATFNISTSGNFNPGGSAGNTLYFQTVPNTTITLSGPVGGALTGPMQLNAWKFEPQTQPVPVGNPNFTLTGTATLQNNTLTYVGGAGGTNITANIKETLTPK